MRMIIDHAYEGDEKYAWFYCRDPYYIENVSKDKKVLFESEGEYEHNKLVSLKDDLLASGYPNHFYDNPSQLYDTLTKDIESYIDQNYPKGSELSPLDSERFRHNSYAKSFTRSYLSNQNNFMNLDKHASHTSTHPLVVIGDSGIGKSALLANWAKRYKEHHPEDIFISHFVGCSPTSTHHISMLSRIMSEVQFALSDYKTPVPTDPQMIVEVFSSWLDKILTRNKSHRLVLLVDSIDSLDNRENALELIWLPQNFPPTVRFFISTVPTGRCWEVLKRREIEQITVSPLSEPERISFLRNKLNESSKKLSEEQEFKIAATPQSGNPRYLQTLVEDLSLWGEFDELDIKIERDLKTQNCSELYEIVFSRLESDYDNNEKSILNKFLSYLWGSRRGLYIETELGMIFQEQKIEQHIWISIYNILEEFLLSSGGLISFSNRDIKKAVENRYLNTPEKKRSIHKELASFFSSLEGYTERKAEELPWQLEQAEEWIKLKDCISDLRIFDKLYNPNHKFDLFRYWRMIENMKFGNPVVSYNESLGYTDSFPSGELVAAIFYRVAHFFEEIGKYEGAEEVYVKARYHYQLASQNLDVAKMEYSLARVEILLAHFREAEENLNKALATYIREKGENDLEVSHVLLRLGSLYTQIGKISEAEISLERCMRIREEKCGFNSSRVGQTLKHLLSLYEEQGNYVKATECAVKALKILEDNFGPDDPGVGNLLLRLGHIYNLQGKYKEAKSALKRSLNISENKFGHKHPSTADVMYELGCYYLMKPETLGKENKEFAKDKAERIMEEALQIKEGTLGPNHPDVSRIINRLGSLYVERVELVRAEKAYTRALKIREEKFGKDHSRVAQTLRHLVTLYELQERIPEAIKAAENCLRISKKIHGEESLQFANVQLRLGQLYFAQDGHSSYQGKKHLNNVIAIKEKKLGKEHIEVKETKRLLEIMEKPPQEIVVTPVKYQSEVCKKKDSEKIKEEISQYWVTNNDETQQFILESLLVPPAPPSSFDSSSFLSPVPPAPPAPPLNFDSAPFLSPVPPAPPAPPPSLQAPTYSNSKNLEVQDILKEIKSGKPLKKKVINVATNHSSKEGWWKQNYQFQKK